MNKIKYTYKIPTSLIYPIIAAFRILMNKEGTDWEYDPIEAWEELGSKLILTALEQLENVNRNPEKFAKTRTAWSTLYDKVNIWKLERQNIK